MSESNKGKKIGKIGYYSIVAFSLAVIGSVSWFTVSRLGALNIKDEKSEGKQSYQSSESSYNNSEQKDKKTEEAATKTESEPYESAVSQITESSKFQMPVEGAITKAFSNSALQYSSTYGDLRIHDGIDIKCEEGTAVLSAYRGTVSDITDDSNLGKTVIVDHGNGIKVKYCGLKTVAVVKGAAVESGTQLGTSGTVPSECKDAPHIHIEAADESGLASLMQIFGVGE